MCVVTAAVAPRRRVVVSLVDLGTHAVAARRGVGHAEVGAAAAPGDGCCGVRRRIALRCVCIKKTGEVTKPTVYVQVSAPR